MNKRDLSPLIVHIESQKKLVGGKGDVEHKCTIDANTNTKRYTVEFNLTLIARKSLRLRMVRMAKGMRAIPTKLATRM